MAFPTHPQLRESVFLPFDDPDVYVGENGEARTFTTYTEAPGQFLLRLRLSAAQLQEWEDHYDANQYASDSFTWQMDSSSHDCYWESPPVSQRLTVNLFDVQVTLRKAT